MVFERLEQMGVGFETGSKEFMKERPTIVMIHGAGGSARIWQEQTEPLADTVNALAIDLPGHGNTRGDGMESIGGYAAWLGKNLEEVFETPVFLMGHSMGGAIALETALQFPSLPKGIILVGSGARLKVAPAFLKGFLEKYEETIDLVMGFAFAPGTDPAKVREAATIMKAAGPKVAHNDFAACDLFDRSGDLDSVETPCLIVCGDQDKLTPPKLSEDLGRSIKESSLVILPSAGHHVMTEVSEAFNQCILDFIKE